MTYAHRVRPVAFVFLAMFALLLASLSQVVFAKITTTARPEVRVTKKVENSINALRSMATYPARYAQQRTWDARNRALPLQACLWC
jgi:hypothetical protein